MSISNSKKYPQKVDQSWVQDLLIFVKNTNFEILTTEGKIYFFLATNDNAIIKEVMIASNSSYRGFYLALEKLKAKGLVTIRNDSKDGRVRRVSLSKTGA